ncbi:FAD:protein FMN transferase [Gordonibacter massiliensis (ex Traore et al. 2017)]|uniref:FAD:protein FMN transferase n=1 Tax=Gordonibacter massiliensis (ex Traore et al. 2017) TaxID=1841863 RepID=UPI001FE82E99|nr:FAD:protein FMN transferase [Gordonibacter massiliensis (ex Traore et al. 2017)]
MPCKTGKAPTRWRAAALACAAALLVLACAGCADGAGSAASSTSATSTRSFTSMATGMTLTVHASNQQAADDAAEACEDRVEQLDRLLAANGDESQIALLNNAGGTVTFVSDDLQPLFEAACSVAQETGGAFDPTIYPLTSAWGFTDGNHRVPSDDELAALLPRVGFERLRADASAGTVVLEDNAQVDVGGVAKGFAADELRALLAKRDVASALLDLGGNVTALGTKPDGSAWRVGVADPAAPDRLAGTLELVDATASTSGTYQRFFVDGNGVKRHHLIDPATGYPAESDLASVTVVGTCGARCDALSTALFVMGSDRALDVWRAQTEGGSGSFEAVFVGEGGNVLVTEGIASAFSPSADFADRVTEVRR